MWTRVNRPFSVVDLHRVRVQNGLNFWILRAKLTINHVPHARKRIFDSVDLSWPFVTWLDPVPNLVWHFCSQDIFTSPLRLLWPSFQQKLSIFPALGFVIQKRKIIDIWPDLDQRLRANLKILRMLWRNLEENYLTPPRGARYDHCTVGIYPTLARGNLLSCIASVAERFHHI